METIRTIVLQEANEERFNRKHIDKKIRDAIEANPEMVAKVDEGVELIHEYMSQDYYHSKNMRIAQLANMDIRSLVLDIFIGIAYCLKPELFTSVSAQMASRLNFSDRAAGITTVAELMAVLCQTDAFDINKADASSSLVVQSCIYLGDELIDFIRHSQYLPPMLCPPLELTHNFSSGYLTHNDSLILGTGNHHDGDICLDVLNKMNSVAMKLDTDFLCKVEEEANSELVTQDQIDNWNDFKKQSYMFYMLLAEQGNEFYFTNKVDKRGRIYTQGYHMNIQGAAFKKAQLELAKEELVEGVPNE